MYKQQNQFGLISAPLSSQTTGTQKIQVKIDDGHVQTKQKINYHDPVSGVSQKITIQSKYHKTVERLASKASSNFSYQSQSQSSRSSSSSRTSGRSRSLSHERKMRNLAYQDTLDKRNQIKASSEKVNHQPVKQTGNIQLQDFINKAINHEFDQAEPKPLAQIQNYPTELTAQMLISKKGELKTKGDSLVRKQKIRYIDPQTGKQTSRKIKATYKDKNTVEKYDSEDENNSECGEDCEVKTKEYKQKYRIGGIRNNIRNKLGNLIKRRI